MAHTTVILDTRSKKKNGTFPVKIRVTHKGEFYISTKIDLQSEQLQNGVIVNHPLAARYNNLITARKLEVDRQLVDLQESVKLSGMTCTRLKEFLERGTGNAVVYLAKYLDKYLERVHNKSTEATFRSMFAKVSKFCDTNSLTFDEIDIKWLIGFDEYMITSGMATNARGVYMRTLRRLFNVAIDDEVISNYPFRKFKIKQEETAKRSLTIEELLILRDYPCEPHQEKYRDLFMLIFYLVGINTIDLFDLKEVRNGRIEYRRSKTGRLFSIKVEPEAQAIIDKYKGEGYLLDVMDNYGNYKDFAHRMNNNLKQIGSVERKGLGGKKYREVLFPKLSTYWARHTWATTAAELDIPDETISLALGHSSGNRVTNIYINRNQRKVDEANRKVIDFLFGEGAEANE